MKSNADGEESISVIDKEKEGWCYIDENMVLQGPFTDEKMEKWILLVMHMSDKKFQKLGDSILLNAEEHDEDVSAEGNQQNTQKISDEERSGLEEEKSELEKTRWVYRDDNGAQQGPFEFSDMYKWFAWNYFPMNLQLRLINELKYVALENRREFPRYKEILSLLDYSTGVEGPNEEDEEESELVGQYYIVDGEGKTQGPYEMSQVGGWLLYGDIPSHSILAKVVDAGEGGAETSPFKKAEEYPELQQYIASKNMPNVVGINDDYEQSGRFNRKTGRYQKHTSEEHFEKMGVESNKDDRQIGTYVDLENYQEELQKSSKKRRPVKNIDWARVKAKRRKMRLLREYSKE